MNQDNIIKIDDVEYDIEKFNDNAKMLLKHVIDLDSKIGFAKFNLDQLQVGRDKFFELLKTEITNM